MRAHLQHPSNEDDPSVPRSTSASVGGGVRKKGTTARAWIAIDAAGKMQVVEVGKHAIMHRTGLPARDLRVLDPNLSYPSTVMGRERAIVINLEQIKAIITAQEILIPNSRDPSVTSFVDELQERVARRHRQATNGTQEGNGDDLVKPQSSGFTQFHDQVEDDGEGEAGKQELQNRDGIKILPFEFVALEACLEAACTELENGAKTLEKETYPALDKLISNITTLNLERVRQIKSRLVAITGRVQKVRDDLEHLLDDDEDMAEMYLTDKLVQRQLESSPTMSMNEGDDADNKVLQLDMDDRMAPDITLKSGGGSASYDDHQNDDNSRDQVFGATSVIGRDSHGILTSTTHSGATKDLDVQELEMLLEAYFVQIDGTLSKLSTLKEYVDDTEDYINIMLDDKQNQLLRMGVMLSTSTLILTGFIIVAGIMGMNIHIELWDQTANSMRKWLWTVGGCSAGCILLYVLAFAWYKHKRLLD